MAYFKNMAAVITSYSIHYTKLYDLELLMPIPTEVLDVCRGLKDDMTAFLDRLMRFPSVSGYEGPAMNWLHDQMGPLADVCELVPVPES